MKEEAEMRREEVDLRRQEMEERSRHRESLLEEQRRRENDGVRDVGRRLDLLEQHLQQQNQIMLQILQNQQHQAQMLAEISRKLEQNK